MANMARAMGTNSRPPDLMGRPPTTSSTTVPSTTTSSSSAGTSAWAGARTQAGVPHIQRPYHQNIFETSSSTSNIILQIRLFKLITPEKKPLNISDSQLGEFLFESLKIPIAQCLALDFLTGRYDLREILVRSDTDLTIVLTYDSLFTFKDHKISISIISNQSTRVTFKEVPLSVPNDELLYLSSLHGVIKDGIVHNTTVRLGGKTRVTMPSSNRWIEVRLTPSKPLRNYYWMTGPGQGEARRRVTVLQPNQEEEIHLKILTVR